MNASLANLTRNLNGNYKYTKVLIDAWDMPVDGKDIFPYNFLDSASKFETLIDDIKHQDFYNILTKTNITEDEFNNIKLTCKSKNIRILEEWHDFVFNERLLLINIFKRFRKVCFDNYKLDLCHFVSAPDLSWNAFLYSKYREDPKFKIELMTDSDMHLMIEQGMRSGLSQISHRYVKTSIDKEFEEYSEVDKDHEATEDTPKTVTDSESAKTTDTDTSVDTSTITSTIK